MKKTTKIFIVLAIALAFVGYKMISKDSSDNTGFGKDEIENPRDKNDSEKERAQKIDYALSQFKDMIKKRMKDPDSFEIRERLYDHDDKGDTVKLIIEYSGKNSYGGRVVNVAYGIYDISTETIRFTERPDVE